MFKALFVVKRKLTSKQRICKPKNVQQENYLIHALICVKHSSLKVWERIKLGGNVVHCIGQKKLSH